MVAAAIPERPSTRRGPVGYTSPGKALTERWEVMVAAADHRRKPRATPPPRDPAKSRLSTQAFVRGLVLILAAILVGVGITYLLGPTPTAASLVAMAGLFSGIGGMHTWGVLLTAAGVLIAARQYLLGHALAALVLTIWAGCSAVTIAQGTATAASGPATIGGWAMVHLWMLYAHRASRWSP